MPLGYIFSFQCLVFSNYLGCVGNKDTAGLALRYCIGSRPASSVSARTTIVSMKPIVSVTLFLRPSNEVEVLENQEEVEITTA